MFSSSPPSVPVASQITSEPDRDTITVVSSSSSSSSSSSTAAATAASDTHTTTTQKDNSKHDKQHKQWPPPPTPSLQTQIQTLTLQLHAEKAKNTVLLKHIELEKKIQLSMDEETKMYKRLLPHYTVCVSSTSPPLLVVDLTSSIPSDLTASSTHTANNTQTSATTVHHIHDTHNVQTLLQAINQYNTTTTTTTSTTDLTSLHTNIEHAVFNLIQSLSSHDDQPQCNRDNINEQLDDIGDKLCSPLLALFDRVMSSSPFISPSLVAPLHLLIFLLTASNSFRFDFVQQHGINTMVKLIQLTQQQSDANTSTHTLVLTLYCLSTLIDNSSIAAAAQRVGAIRAILGILKYYTQHNEIDTYKHMMANSEMIQAVASLLSLLCLYPPNRKLIATLGGIELLLSIIKLMNTHHGSRDEESILLTAILYTLESLTRDSSCISLFHAHDGVDILVLCMHMRVNDLLHQELIRAACNILTHVAQGDENTLKVCRRGGHACLLESIKRNRDNGDILSVSCRAIDILCNVPENQQKVSMLDGIELLLDILLTFVHELPLLYPTAEFYQHIYMK